MSTIRFLQDHLSRQKYVDLMFAIQTLHRESSFSEKILELIEEHLINYYEIHLDSKKNPRVMCAVLVYFYGKQDHKVSMMQVCQMFDVNLSWFRKIHLNYLEKAGMEIQQLSSQHQQRNWRWFTSPNNNLSSINSHQSWDYSKALMKNWRSL